MLVLSRKKNERVVATTESGERIVLTILDVHGDKVRLGFEAAKTTTIHREEVQRQVEAERRPVPAPNMPFGFGGAYAAR